MIRKLSAKRYPLNAKSGQALVEVLLAVAIGALFLGAAAIVTSSLLVIKAKNRDFQTAIGLAAELSNKVRLAADADWNDIYGLTKPTTTYYISTAGQAITPTSGTETTSIDGVTFSRYFTVANVSRALCGTGAATTTATTTCTSGPGSVGVADDPSWQSVTLSVLKGTGTSAIALLSYGDLITRSRNKIFRQTDWSGGSGQESFSASDIASGLLIYWPFDEGSGSTTADLSGNNLNGTLLATPEWVTGHKSNGLQFSSSSDLVYVNASTSINNLAAFTFSAWIYPRSAGQATWGTIVSKAYTETTGLGWMLDFGGSASRQINLFWPYSVSGLWRYTAPSTITFNTWKHVVATWDGTTPTSSMRIYFNNVETTYDGYEQAGSGTKSNDAAQEFKIGNNDTRDSGFDGTIDEVRLYNRVLTSNEIAALYNDTGSSAGGVNSKFTTSTNVNFSSTTGSITMTATSSVIASTSLISSVFDTEVTNGAAYNSMLWQGTAPAGATVRIQLATSANSSGPWTYLGYDGTASTYYSAAPNTAMPIARLYANNKRFFRYKIFLTTTSNSGPTVDDVVVNYGP